MCVGCLWTRLFMAVRMKLSAAVSDFGGRRYRHFGLKLFWRPQGPLVRVCGMSMGAGSHGGSNETIGGCIRLRRQEITFGFGGLKGLRSLRLGCVRCLWMRLCQRHRQKLCTIVNDSAYKFFLLVSTTPPTRQC